CHEDRGRGGRRRSDRRPGGWWQGRSDRRRGGWRRGHRRGRRDRKAGSGDPGGERADVHRDQHRDFTQHGETSQISSGKAGHGFTRIARIGFAFIREILVIRGLFFGVTDCTAHHAAFFRYSSTSSAWPSAFTLGKMCAMRPSGPMTKVVRSIPITLLPYMFFSLITPKASPTFLSVSASRV